MRNSLALVLALVASPLPAQVVRGVVLDASTRVPVDGATIEVLPVAVGPAIRATADTLGFFNLTLPGAGTYTIQARRVGFLTAPPDTLTIGRDETLSIEMRLDSRAVPLEPMVVTVRGNAWLADFERRKAGAFGRFITRKDIEAQGAQQTTSLFRLMPGFVVQPRRRGVTSELLMRGPVGLCQPAVWIDGLYVALNQQMTLDNVLSPGMIEGVEVYNSSAAAPTQYRTGSCGVLLFWTRRGSAEEGERVHWRKLLVGASVAALLVFLVAR